MLQDYYEYMGTLIIKNVGPIKCLNIDLNRFNIFIGPQSSGKSTIAKIISFSHWLEKDILVHQSTDYIETSTFIEENLIKFHKLKGYINENSFISYYGDVVKFQIEGKNKFTIEKENSFENKKVGKIAYIPSERNLITLQGIESLPLPRDNMRTFLFDWLSVHRKYDENNTFNILDLGVKFYFDENNRQDTILLENGNKISLYAASSGLQSIVPLCVYFYDVVRWVYDHIEDISFQKRNLYLNLIYDPFLRSLRKKGIIDDNMLTDQQRKEELVETLTSITTELRKAFPKLGDTKISPSIEKILRLEDNITKPHFSSIIIEEPEQNLFPKTQETLLYYLLGLIDKSRDKLVITTHSPYILYALNNCMLGWIVKDNIKNEDEIEAIKFKASWVNPKDVSVWELRNGYIIGLDKKENKTIQDQDGLISSNYFDRIMKNITTDFAELLQYIPENESIF